MAQIDCAKNSPATTEKVMNTSYFATNLESLTLIIKNAGCKPILVTSLARRVFTSEHVTSDILGPYSNETINVAAKLNLPVSISMPSAVLLFDIAYMQILPLLNDSLTYITKLGKAKSMLFNWDSATTKTRVSDYEYLEEQVISDNT